MKSDLDIFLGYNPKYFVFIKQLVAKFVTFPFLFSSFDQKWSHCAKIFFFHLLFNHGQQSRKNVGTPPEHSTDKNSAQMWNLNNRHKPAMDLSKQLGINYFELEKTAGSF